MKRSIEGRHPADHQGPSTGVQVRQFWRIARGARQGWHRAHGRSGSSRLVQFLRIARGWTT
ncbi:hypothetical protein [Tabrizicola sp.]|uniref:hypothetical protein n=1 Tax=Tabrizicola sp. TaxID=2005166 RepID=UPI00286AE5FE|nr:hypothetical protein [Tabrizicola sp.]